MNLLPPETSSPMPPQLHWVYAKELGWPGLPEARPPAALPPRTVTAPQPSRWPAFITKMSAHTPKLGL